MPAYERAFAEHEAEIAKIADQKEPPTFDNTIVALENAGRALQRVDDVFGQLVGTDSNDTLLAIERDISPRTAAHWNKVRMNDGLFARHRRALSEARQPRPHRRAEARAGAPSHQASPRGRGARPRQEASALPIIVERLAALGTAFSQNVLADEQSYTMELDGEADLAGLPDFRARSGGRRGRPSAA